MRYQGSKRALGKKLLPPMLEARGNRPWVEPFVGAGNMIDQVQGERYGNDADRYIIAMLKALQAGWLPPEHFTKEEREAIRAKPHIYPSELVGFCAYAGSFGGQRWGTYTIDKKKGFNRSIGESYRACVKQAPLIRGVVFTAEDYQDMLMPEGSLIYCDPPYAGTDSSYLCGIDHKIFWDWCRQKHSEGHIVFVSEYDAPNDFETVLTIEHESQTNLGIRTRRVEKLFRANP